MGGSNSHTGHKTKHFYFGQVIKKKNYGKQYITVNRPILSKDIFNQWKQKYQIVQGMNHKDSLFIPDDYDFKKIQKSASSCGCCCGAQGETQMTYEDVQFLYSSELVNRKSKNMYYQEPQLILIMYKLLEGSKEFQNKDINLGDIRPKNILITKGQDIKMVNIASFPSEKTSIQKITENFDNKTIFYLAPEEIQFLKSKGYSGRETVPNAKTEAFSIGLTVLEAATLQSSEELYKMPKRQFDQGLFKKREEKVGKKYPVLYEFLANILKIDSSQRMTSGECWATMRVYSQKIAELEKFKRNKSAENESVRKFFAGVSTTRS